MRFPPQRALLRWLAVGWIAFLVLPWNAIGGRGFFAFAWLGTYPFDPKTAPAAVQLVVLHRLWLLPLALMLIGATVMALRDVRAPDALAAAGATGLATLAAVAVAIDLGGWTWPPLATIFGPLPGRQPGLGYGALGAGLSALMLVALAVAQRGWVRGDRFVAGAIAFAVGAVGLFTLYPLARLLLRAFVDRDGNWSLAAFAARIASSRVWGVGGVVWNTLDLGLCTAL